MGFVKGFFEEILESFTDLLSEVGEIFNDLSDDVKNILDDYKESDEADEEGLKSDVDLAALKISLAKFAELGGHFVKSFKNSKTEDDDDDDYDEGEEDFDEEEEDYDDE